VDRDSDSATTSNSAAGGSTAGGQAQAVDRDAPPDAKPLGQRSEVDSHAPARTEGADLQHPPDRLNNSREHVGTIRCDKNNRIRRGDGFAGPV